MFTSIRSAVWLSAIAAAMLVMFDGSAPRAENAASQVAQRFPLASETFTPVPVTAYVRHKFIAAQKITATPKTHRPTVAVFCANTPNGWPYVSPECRVA